VFPGLAAQSAGLAYQVAAMSFEQAQGLPVVIQRGLEQGTAIDGSTMDGEQVGVVGFVTRIGGLAKLLGGEGMDDARFQAGGSTGALDGAMVTPGALDGDEEVAEIMGSHGLPDEGDGGVECRTVICHFRWGNKHIAKEVAEHPFAACFGAVRY
jgi:hypothetical protein